MNTRRWFLTALCTLAILIGLIASASAPATLAEFAASERYRLVASEVEKVRATVVQPAYLVPSQGSEYYHLVASGIGDIPIAMESGSYTVNEGIVVRAEVVPPMQSEHYKAGGEVPRRAYLPLVLRRSD